MSGKRKKPQPKGLARRRDSLAQGWALADIYEQNRMELLADIDPTDFDRFLHGIREGLDRGDPAFYRLFEGLVFGPAKTESRKEVVDVAAILAMTMGEDDEDVIDIDVEVID